MNKPKPTSPKLHLSVQYATPCPELPRWRLRRWVERSLEALELDSQYQSIQINIRFVDQEEGLFLNTQYRAKEYATNILTFEYGLDEDGNLSADLIICVDVLVAEAKQQQKPFLHHAAHLTVHGTLHALGFDHIDPTEAEEMESLERDILKNFAIPDPYRVC